MEIGVVGLGRMGSGIAERLVQRGHRVVAYDREPGAVRAAVARGALGATSLLHLVEQLALPRAIWLALPAGQTTQSVLDALAPLLTSGDAVLDGGNSHYRDTMRRADDFKSQGLFLLDVGTSGGIWGTQEGYCLMVGGEVGAFRRLEPLFQALAPGPDRGYGHMGPSGAGHFVKMVHNGIEYGLMEAYAEGFELLRAKEELPLDLARVAQVWRHGSVIRSWLLDLAAESLAEDPDLERADAFVEDTGEGRWTVQESVDLGVPIPAITLALQARFRSRQSRPFGARLLALLRHRFGGHPPRSAGA
ncbi:MAG: decarboxylating 6-phosphogluconate dehydrogenase [Chloroflexi bacterium]|nr:decarboxylating 6-phosphogluconate dehydrogenase [Chloroflexota bacterium]